MHVCDLVDAHILVLKWSLSGNWNQVLNFGTADGFSVRQIIDNAKHVTNQPDPVTHRARRSGACTQLVSGSLRAKKSNWEVRLIART